MTLSDIDKRLQKLNKSLSNLCEDIRDIEVSPGCERWRGGANSLLAAALTVLKMAGPLIILCIQTEKKS